MQCVLFMTDWFMCGFVKVRGASAPLGLDIFAESKRWPPFVDAGVPFSQTLPWESVLRIWDIFLYDGRLVRTEGQKDSEPRV